jgi:hypothetical protein
MEIEALKGPINGYYPEPVKSNQPIHTPTPYFFKILLILSFHLSIFS